MHTVEIKHVLQRRPDRTVKGHLVGAGRRVKAAVRSIPALEEHARRQVRARGRLPENADLRRRGLERVCRPCAPRRARSDTRSCRTSAAGGQGFLAEEPDGDQRDLRRRR